jgi:hypothetical protein
MRPIVVAVSTLLDTLRRRTVSSRTVPVFLAGMWPSTPGVPDSGTRVALAEKGGGSVLLQGFSDPSGAFRGRLPKTWVGKDVCVIVREPSFKFHYANPVRVERWGLFLAIRQEQDRVHSVSEDSKCARSLDPGRHSSAAGSDTGRPARQDRLPSRGRARPRAGHWRDWFRCASWGRAAPRRRGIPGNGTADSVLTRAWVLKGGAG